MIRDSDSDNCFICRFISLFIQCCCSPADRWFLKLLLNENAIGLYWSETSLKAFQFNGLWWCWMLSSEMFLSKVCVKPQDRVSLVSCNCSALACMCVNVCYLSMENISSSVRSWLSSLWQYCQDTGLFFLSVTRVLKKCSKCCFRSCAWNADTLRVRVPMERE